MNPQWKLKLAMAFSWAFHAFAGAASGAETIEYQFPLATVWAISDRQLTVPTAGQESLLTNISPAEIRKIRPDAPLTSTVEFNVYLVKTEKQLALIDTGFGKDAGGQLIAKLAEINVAPEKITDVYLTHLHGDHCGGLLLNRQAAFPNAVVHLSEAEAAYWRNPQTPNRETAGAVLLANQGQIRAFALDNARGADLGEFSALALFGHTPGHTAFGVDLDDSRTLIFAGDFMHQIAVQSARPETSIQYDVDPQAAIISREKFLTEITSAPEVTYIIAGAHLPFPGLFTFAKSTGDGYKFQPVLPADNNAGKN